MNYVKKMCILRQVKQGFSGDGKALSGLIKIEQYGKNLAVEVSIINFAPLVSGEYYCLLSDGKGKTEMLSLRGKSLFNILSDLDISGGFCGIICYVKNDIVPIAYGINGNGSYDWRAILNATLPPVFPKISQENALATTEGESFFQKKRENEPPMSVSNDSQDSPKGVALHDPLKELSSDMPPDDLPEPIPQKPTSRQTTPPPSAPLPPTKTAYDDDSVATENYYDREADDAQIESDEAIQNARAESTAEKQDKKKRSDPSTNGDADRVLHPFKTDPDGYYLSVKGELDELFRTYPRDKTLNGAFSCSEWVRLKGTAKQPQYLVGVLYDDGRAKYVCYALVAEDKDNPPEEIKNVCAFVPCSALKDHEGFFVLFQSAATGECVKPERA